VLEVVKRKAKGKAAAIGAPRPPKGKVIDLMEALRQSLAKKDAGASPRRARVATRRRA
jgi:non-homologous end joining protein Ku